MVLLGLGSRLEALETAFAAAAGEPLCRGYAIGRSVFAEAAEGWFTHQLADKQVVDQIVERLRLLANRWAATRARQQSQV